MENFEPEDAKRQRIWARLSSEVREARLAEARRRLEAIREVARRPEGESERKATARVVTWAHRSSLQRWKRRHETQGFEGLVSWRIAPPSRMPEEVRQEVRTLARASLRVEAICAHLLEHFEYTTSASTVKGILREEGLARPRGRPPGKGIRGEQRLELGGMKLIEAVAQETGYVKALADAVMEHVGDLGRPAEPRGPDIADRDEYGRFLPTYNDRYRKGPDDAIGPGFASVATKREGMDPDLFQVSQVRHEIIERKLYGLLVSPLLGGGRWDGIRVPRGDLLGELCGFAYMPATLDKFTRELKYAGAASTLWEVQAQADAGMGRATPGGGGLRGWDDEADLDAAVQPVDEGELCGPYDARAGAGGVSFRVRCAVVDGDP